MADIVAGICPQVKTHTEWASLNPTLGRSSYGQIVHSTGSPFGDIMVWGKNQTYNVAYSAGQFYQGIGPLSLTSGRNALEESYGTVDTTTTDAWYTVAQLPSGSQFSGFYAEFVTSFLQGGIKYSVGEPTRTSNIKRTCKLLDIFGVSTLASTPINARICSSSTVATSGVKVQVKLDTTADGKINTIMTSGTGSKITNGFEVVDAYIDNGTVTLPDGSSTADIFVEAGTVFSFANSGVTFIEGFTANRISDDILDCELRLDNLVKPDAATVTITLPSTYLRVYDGAGNTTTVSTPVSSSVVVVGNRIKFRITDTGIATGLNAGPLFFKASGTGGGIVIS